MKTWRFATALAAAMLGCVAHTPAAAQSELRDGPKSLIISYRASAAHRAPFRRYLLTNLAPRLRAMQAKGEISGFRVLYSWYRQPQVWDALLVLHFPTFAGVARWNALERTTPGGLDVAGLALADPVASYSSDLSWSRDAGDLRDGEVYYVIPYEYREAAEYRAYVAGYVLPEFDGWVREGALTGYELYMNRYSNGVPWDALFIQRYRDMAAFGRRQQVIESVRATLRGNAEWKSWSDRKAGIRTETENSIAELIAH